MNPASDVRIQIDQVSRSSPPRASENVNSETPSPSRRGRTDAPTVRTNDRTNDSPTTSIVRNDSHTVRNDSPTVRNDSPTTPTVRNAKPSHGWTSDARKLVKVWAAQVAINRQKHQQSADSMGAQSTNMKIAAAVFGSGATLLPFLNTAFGAESDVARITLDVFAGVFAAISTLISVILAILGLDSEAEKHRQTAIQYANVCNEAQTVLVEEHEENLPQATDFLRRMKDLTHLIQLFGPSLEERSDSDLPSIILLRGIRNNSGSIPQNNQKNDDMADDFAGIFDHDDRVDNSPQSRRRKREDMLNALKNDTFDIKRRQQELQAEEAELKNLSRMMYDQVILNDGSTVTTAAKPSNGHAAAPSVIYAQGPSVVPTANVVPTVVPNVVPNVVPTATVSAPVIPSVAPTVHTVPTTPVIPTTITTESTDERRLKKHRSIAETILSFAPRKDARSEPILQNNPDSAGAIKLSNFAAVQSSPVSKSMYTYADSDEGESEDNWSEQDSDNLSADDPVLSRDRISPIVRSSLRESMFNNYRGGSDIRIASPNGSDEPIQIRDNIAQNNDLSVVDIGNIPTSSSSSRTQSGEAIDAYDETTPRHTLTEVALSTIDTVQHGLKKMQIAPEVLLAEIRRREDNISAQRRELKDKKRNNRKMQHKLEEERREGIKKATLQSQRKGSEGSVQSQRRTSASPGQSVITLSSSSPRSSSPPPRSSPPKSSTPKASPNTSQAEPPKIGVIDRLKVALSPQKSNSKGQHETVEDVHVAQREKMLAIQDLCDDELSFECMREGN
jgi:hypothetical protein